MIKILNNETRIPKKIIYHQNTPCLVLEEITNRPFGTSGLSFGPEPHFLCLIKNSKETIAIQLSGVTTQVLICGQYNLWYTLDLNLSGILNHVKTIHRENNLPARTFGISSDDIGAYYIVNNKFHRTNGFAIENQKIGDQITNSYYVDGIQYFDEISYLEAVKKYNNI